MKPDALETGRSPEEQYQLGRELSYWFAWGQGESRPEFIPIKKGDSVIFTKTIRRDPRENHGLGNQTEQRTILSSDLAAFDFYVAGVIPDLDAHPKRSTRLLRASVELNKARAMFKKPKGK